MTSKQYREALAGLGMSQARLGRLLGRDKSTPNRWATGRVPIPREVELLLLLALSIQMTADDLDALA